MTPIELQVIAPLANEAGSVAEAGDRDERWRRAARRARALSWASLAWMTVEGVAGLIAGLDAGALSVIVWAASSFAEGLASMIVIWRFTGSRTMSARSEQVAQRLVAGSFLLLVPFFLFESVHRLVVGSDVQANALGVAVTASAIVLMPGLGWAKLRLGAQLQSGATSGEGIQNLLCAAQAAAALVALIGASAGLGLLDPIAAVVIALLAVRESLTLWTNQSDACCAPVGFTDTADSSRRKPGYDCC
jgi:divalent metal cation (Fe/Co/Zn/Cd) transporter